LSGKRNPSAKKGKTIEPIVINRSMNSMILFNTTVIISDSAESEWLKWMKDTQIPAIMATGLPVDYRLFRLVTDTGQEGTTYTCQFLFNSMAAFEVYSVEYQEFFNLELHELFKDQYFSFQTVLEEVVM
jgi:hypothetical protein